MQTQNCARSHPQFLTQACIPLTLVSRNDENKHSIRAIIRSGQTAITLYTAAPAARGEALRQLAVPQPTTQAEACAPWRGRGRAEGPIGHSGSWMCAITDQQRNLVVLLAAWQVFVQVAPGSNRPAARMPAAPTHLVDWFDSMALRERRTDLGQIGRASCRERV